MALRVDFITENVNQYLSIINVCSAETSKDPQNNQ